MDNELVKAIDNALEANTKLAREYMRKVQEYDLEGNVQLSSYWLTMYNCLKTDIRILNDHKKLLLTEES